MVESLPIYSPVYDVMNTISNKVFSLSQVDSGLSQLSAWKKLVQLSLPSLGMSWYVLARPSTPTGPPTGLGYSYFIDIPQYESYQSKLSGLIQDIENHISYILLFRSDICMITYDESTIISSTLELGEVLNLSNAPITWILKSRIVTESSTE